MGKLNDIYIQESLKVILESIPEYTVTTVVAPMGYGKTTAVTSFLKGLGSSALIFRLNMLADLEQLLPEFSEFSKAETGIRRDGNAEERCGKSTVS